MRESKEGRWAYATSMKLGACLPDLGFLTVVPDGSGGGWMRLRHQRRPGRSYDVARGGEGRETVFGGGGEGRAAAVTSEGESRTATATNEGEGRASASTSCEGSGG